MIWLVGAQGMLGQEVALRLEAEGLAWCGTDRELDIRDQSALVDWLAGQAPVDCIVNCAAYTAVDKAEDEPELARSINADAVGNLAMVAERSGAGLVHLSTDYVFDGQGIRETPDGPPRAYREDDPEQPVSVYGRTKAQGEVIAHRACSRTVILRTAWLYGAFGPNFVKTMLRLMAERTEIGVVADQFGSPTSARELAKVVLAAAQGHLAPGIWHATGSGHTTWHDFAQAIHDQARRFGILDRDCTIRALRTDQYPTKALRPAWSVLDTSRLSLRLGWSLPDWRVSLEASLEDYSA